MKSPKTAVAPDTTPPASTPVPPTGGSWIHDETTGALTRVGTPVEVGFEAPDQPALKEAQ